jgi:hypothetical protein
MNIEEIMKKYARLSPQFVVDDDGKKRMVLLSYAVYQELIQDLNDLALFAERRDEESLSLNELKQ